MASGTNHITKHHFAVALSPIAPTLRRECEVVSLSLSTPAAQSLQPWAPTKLAHLHTHPPATHEPLVESIAAGVQITITRCVSRPPSSLWPGIATQLPDSLILPLLHPLHSSVCRSVHQSSGIPYIDLPFTYSTQSADMSRARETDGEFALRYTVLRLSVSQPFPPLAQSTISLKRTTAKNHN